MAYNASYGYQPGGTYGYDVDGNPCPPDPCAPQDRGLDYEDYTESGIRKLEDTDLFNRSINITDPEQVDEDVERPPNFRQKVKRRVEVPFTRKVKVPTQTTKVVPTKVSVPVTVKKHVQVPGYKMVEEQYTVFEEREAMREKEIWVKQKIQVPVKEKVPVTKTRQVRKETKEIQEVEETVHVEVPSTKVLNVDGYRIDDVEDTKVVEVEEFQEYEYKAQPVGDAELYRTREIGRIQGQHIGRSVGMDTYEANHPKLRTVDLDSNPAAFDAPPEQAMFATRSMPLDDPPVSSRRSPRPNYNDPNDMPAAGTNRALLSTNTAAVRQASGGLGLSVKNTHTRHSDGTGVLVTKIDRGGAAAQAGLVENDIITAVNNEPTTTVEQFAGVLSRNPGPIGVQFNRDGRRNMFARIVR